MESFGVAAAGEVDDDLARRQVARLRDQGAEVEALAERLVGRLDAAGWRGRAAEAMRERVTERARALRRAADRHSLAADALATHLTASSRARDEVAVREARAHRLIAEARERAASAEAPEAANAGDAGDAGAGLDHADRVLLTFDPPPPGHHAWLDVDLPGLEH